MAIGKFGNLVQYIINSTEIYLLFINFRKATIKIKYKKLLDYLKNMPLISKKKLKVYLTIKNIFKGAS